MTDAQTRQANFNRQVVDADEKALPKCVDFAEHRFVSVERDATTDERYVKGHKSMRGACNYMARSVASGELFIPEAIIDLDENSKHDIDLFVHVAPQSVGAVAVLLPPDVVNGLLAAAAGDRTMAVPVAEAVTKILSPAERRKSR